MLIDDQRSCKTSLLQPFNTPDTHLRRAIQSLSGKVKADTSLQVKLKAVSDVDAELAIAKETVFMISADDLKNAQEISEEELEGVTGGEACWKNSNKQSSLIPNYWCGGIDGPKLKYPVLPIGSTKSSQSL